MSKGIRMALVMNLLPLIFSAALVRSDHSAVPLRSFKIDKNVTYDCIDIYKQPGLDHPLLKNHTIQMKPSISRTELKSQIGNTKTYKKKIGCPNGTVPVLRNTKEFITNAQLFAEKYFHPQSVDSPGTHIAGVRSFNGQFHGVKAWFNGYNLSVGKDQASYSQIYIGSGSNNKVDFISAGLMINPGFFGDGRVWKYGFWKGKDGKGCYNTACPGFVQVSPVVPIVEPIVIPVGIPIWTHRYIHQDEYTGNWWITQLAPHGANVDIGYWPKELFNLLGVGANMAGVGGVVQNSHSGSSPPMGNGNFPSGYFRRSALFTNIEVLNSNYEQRRLDSLHIEKLVDSPKCYGLKIGKEFPLLPQGKGFFFNYGGPGGNSCGI